MIITLKGTTFTKFLDLNSWMIISDLVGVTSSNTATKVTKGDPYTTTFTIDTGCTLTEENVSVVCNGVTKTLTWDKLTEGGKATLSFTPDAAVYISIRATGANSGGGEVVDPDPEQPETPNTPTEPADVLQLNAFRYDEDVTINSGGNTSAKTGYNTFYEIPVLPNSVYYINGAVRVALLDSSKAYRNDYNIYTDSGSNVGQASYVRTDASTAFLNITILESKCTIEDAKIQIAQLTTTIKDTKTLASTGATLVTGKKLDSGSYTERNDENYIVYKDIPVTANATYKIAGSARVWFLAEDKTTTKSSVNPTTGGIPEKFCFKVPAGAVYASASIYKNNMDKTAEELELHELTVSYSV